MVFAVCCWDLCDMVWLHFYNLYLVIKVYGQWGGVYGKGTNVYDGVYVIDRMGVFGD